jgi:glycosyltransferase involved in cell wall biosynthesis
LTGPDLEVFGGKFFFLNSLDPQELAILIQYVLQHPSEAQQRAKEAAQIVRDTFSWEKVIDKYLEIYSR